MIVGGGLEGIEALGEILRAHRGVCPDITLVEARDRLLPEAPAALDAHVRATAVTVSHPLGTCRMGVDNNAVTGPDLRFNGLDGLRVVDASVMPDLVGGNINATVIAIAEKAADLIKAG